MKKYLIALIVIMMAFLYGRTMTQSYKLLTIMNKAFEPSIGWNFSPLQGGLSGASLFVAESHEQKCVIRFFEHLTKTGAQELIAAQKTASDCGYGPQVFWSDAEQQVLVMDFIQAEPANPQNTIKDLAALLKKIHSSPLIIDSDRIWKRTYFVLDKLKKVQQSLISINEIEKCLNNLIEKVSVDFKPTTCHRDLNPGNLIFSKGQYFAVDYDSAGIDDPYIDIAQIALWYCHTPAKETELLAAYLDRTPSDTEMAKLQLFQKIAFLFYGSEFLRKFSKSPDANWSEQPEPISFRDYLQLLGQGKVNLQSPRIDYDSCGNAKIAAPMSYFSKSLISKRNASATICATISWLYVSDVA